MTIEGRASVTAISGVGGKGPACFLVKAAGQRLLLDLGYGPQPGLMPDVERIGAVDALIVSHSHKDHIGGLSLLEKVGNPPIYATDMVARRLPVGLATRPLPIRGRTEMLGIPVETGRNGHAPGGVWLCLGIGHGLLYSGDYSTESILYAYDPPPPAATVILDTSYGDDDTPLAERQKVLAPFFAGNVLLPVPEDGRGPDIALHLARSGRLPAIDDAMRKMLRELAGTGHACLRDGVAGELATLAETAEPIEQLHGGARQPRGVMLAAPATGASGETARLFVQWKGAAEPAIVFTGYVPPGSPAERLVKSGRARFLRWNVHPRLSDNVALVRAVGARTVMAAFCDRKFLPALARALAPAQVTMDQTMPLPC